MGQLQNCPMCGRLFVRTIRPICPACHQEIEAQFKKVHDFLRQKENRQATIYEVSEQTGVSVAQIKEFIREGRLVITGLPNMGYPCESCGEIIREGRLCADCRKKFQGVAEKLSQAFSESQRGQNKMVTPYHEEKHKGYRHLKQDDSDQ